MAGIGFEIRRILERDSYWSVLRAYGYAGLVSGATRSGRQQFVLVIWQLPVVQNCLQFLRGAARRCHAF